MRRRRKGKKRRSDKSKVHEYLKRKEAKELTPRYKKAKRQETADGDY